MFDRYIQTFIKYPEAFYPDLLLLLAVVAGLVNFSHLTTAIRVLFVMALLTLGVELVVFHNAANRLNNHYLLNLSSLVELVSLASVYYVEIKRKPSRLAIIIIVLLFFIAFSIYYQSNHIAEYILGVEKILLIVFVFMYFQYLLSEMQVERILIHAMFWLSAGILLYSSGTLLIFLFSKKTLGNPSFEGDFLWYYQVTQLFSMFFYATVAVSFWLCRREKQLQTA